MGPCLPDPFDLERINSSSENKYMLYLGMCTTHSYPDLEFEPRHATFYVSTCIPFNCYIFSLRVQFRKDICVLCDPVTSEYPLNVIQSIRSNKMK